MPKGKKWDIETIYKVMISVFTTGNCNETARLLKLPESTVRTIYDNNIDKEEFAKLREEKREEFIDKASEIVNKSLELIDKRLTTALEKQQELDLLLDTVNDIDNEDMKPKQKLDIAKKLSKIQLQSLSEISTTFGTVYDKRALAQGKSTNNLGIVKLEDVL